MEALQRKTEGMILDYEANVRAILGLRESEEKSEFLSVDNIRESDIVISTDSYTTELSEVDDKTF